LEGAVCQRAEGRKGEAIFETRTKSPEDTVRLGRILGKMLDQGMVVALSGGLGAGKTLLVKGIAGGLGVEDEGEVASPSFVLVNEYSGRFPVYHVDLYRLENPFEVEDLGWEEFFSGSGVTLVEWADKIPLVLPEERIEVQLYWIGEEERKLVFRGRGPIANRLVADLGKKWTGEE